MESKILQRAGMLIAALTLLMTTIVQAQTADAVYVATYIEVRSESAREGAALTSTYERDTRAMAGNVAVTALQESGRPERFVVIETWKDQASFTGHEKAAHTLTFREKLKAIQRAPYDQRVHRGFSIDPQPQKAGSDAIHVVTHVDVPGARREEAEALLKRLIEPSRADQGHVRYDIYQQVEPRLNHFKVISVWNNRRAFDAYGSAPHWQQFREALGPMLGALYDERLYQPLKR